MPIDGLVLLAGLVTFLTGAAFWRPALYQQALPLALTAMAKEPNRLRWIGPAWLGWAGVGAGTASAIGFAAFRGGPFGPPFLAHVYTAVIGIVLLLRV